MSFYSPDGTAHRVVAELFGHSVDRPLHDYRSFGDLLVFFARGVWAPILSGSSKGLQREVYGKLVRAHEMLIDEGAQTEATFVNLSFGVSRGAAFIGGLLFLTGCKLKASQIQVCEIMPFLDPRVTLPGLMQR